MHAESVHPSDSRKLRRILMQATTLSRIIPIVAEELNLEPSGYREKILKEIHSCRHLMYSGLGEAVREAFFLRTECLPVRTFSHDCRSNCNGNYYGWSLPADCVSASVFRIEGKRITVKTEFSGTANEFCQLNLSCPTAIDMGSGFSLPCDPGGPIQLGFRISGVEAPKKKLAVGVRYFDLNDSPVSEAVDLTNEIRFTSRTVKRLSFQGITLPPGRDGMVEIWANDTLLAELHPSIDVPSFRRFAFNGPIWSEEIKMEDGLFEPQMALFDTDPIETGDPNFWRSLVQWKGLHFKTKRNGPENTSYQSLGAFLIQHAQSMLSMKEPDTALPQILPYDKSRHVVQTLHNLRNPRRWR